MFKKLIISIFITMPIFASVISVSVIKPIAKDIAVTVDATGNVIAKNTTSITATTSGLLKMKVSQNSFVTQGELIAQVSNKLRENKIELLKKSLKLQEKGITLQKDKIKTAKEKYQMGVGSQNNYLAQKITLGQLQKQYNSSKNGYEALLLEQTNSLIYAPTSGVITNPLANDSYINYGAKIATLLENKNIIKLFVESTYAQEIQKNMDVKILSSYKNCNAKVITILPRSSNNLVEVMVRTKENLPLNLQINGKIILKYSHGVLIPKSAIVLVQNHPAVYLIDDKNIAHLVFIEIQKDMIDKALIKNTLPKDAKVALKNAYMLHDNLEVSVK